MSKISKLQILEEARQIVQHQGLEKLNIRAVAKRCNVSIGSIYNYYPTKADLVVEIMEDFWKQAFQHDDIKDLSLDNFFDSYLQLYQKGYHYLSQFENNWVQELSQMDSHTRKLSQQMHQEYITNIKKMLMIMLERDQHINKAIWSSTFTKEDFLDFLFSNTLEELKKGNANPHFLIQILKKILL